MFIIMDSMGIMMDSMGIIGVLSLFLIVNDASVVFGDKDEVKSMSMSVKEGDSVTLYTEIVKQRDDMIVWYYGPKKTFVATIKGKVGSTELSKDERFKDRMKLDDQTGSLTINNLTTNHSGVYKLKISSNNTVSYKIFNVTVPAHLPLLVNSRDLTQNFSSSDSRELRIIIIIIVFVLLICVMISIIVYRYKREGDEESLMKRSPAEEPLVDDERIV
ncbi:uncharacterized protein LOC130430469 [Triplophysa dalaica]|uniref:uncharacterized protein LOC130430469 n=1 Tax=Triplophysa dalaica TaxID=1582913 RepID=UPI0024E00B8C|nr:uncharacterized protein LOC130430469 [Triplophysa dalaica]